LDRAVISKIKEFDGLKLVYVEYFGLDTAQYETQRQVMGVFDVIGNVGGIQ